jgi:ABC-type uncharacterized transport system auxiliary subunit
MRRVAALAVAAILCGCAGLQPGQAPRYYTLEAPAAPAEAGPASHDAVLVLAPATVASFYDTQDIVYSRMPGSLAYYQFSRWTEPPGVPFTRQLAARIDQSKAYRAVVIAGSGMGGSLVLATHIEEIYHDAAENPGTARVTLTAEMVDTRHRILVGRRRFSASVPVPSHDAPGAVAGCRQALGLVIDQVVAWTGELATP